MKYSFLFFSLVVIAAASCNNAQKEPTGVTAIEDTSKPVENKIMIPASSCYSSITGKDTVFLKTEIFPNVVTGNLSYKFYEKDSNKGEIDGKLSGDTLIADYKFMSEGKQSTRQVIFLLKDSIASEGYGDMEEKDGKMVFKDISQVSFGKGVVLKTIPCGEN